MEAFYEGWLLFYEGLLTSIISGAFYIRQVIPPSHEYEVIWRSTRVRAQALAKTRGTFHTHLIT